MNILFTPDGWRDLQRLLKDDRKLYSKAVDLIEATARDPFEGIGKPEPLKHQMAGCWSRRVSERHRLVYRVDDGVLTVMACQSHYGD